MQSRRWFLQLLKAAPATAIIPAAAIESAGADGVDENPELLGAFGKFENAVDEYVAVGGAKTERCRYAERDVCESVERLVECKPETPYGLYLKAVAMRRCAVEAVRFQCWPAGSVPPYLLEGLVADILRVLPETAANVPLTALIGERRV